MRAFLEPSLECDPSPPKKKSWLSSWALVQRGVTANAKEAELCSRKDVAPLILPRLHFGAVFLDG